MSANPVRASQSNFSSVKLPAVLVQQPKKAAHKALQAGIVADLTSKLLKVEASGSLARHVRAGVEENRKLAK